jgi:prepilin-type processing-associated H-X9-DG protein/prepilin-type N-terminal cleavage/methylation domain-containing protein
MKSRAVLLRQSSPEVLPRGVGRCVVPRPAARRGFTLIEILVVLGVLLLLAALLFPAFGRVREDGKRKVCLSNMRQIGLTLTQYAQDNDRRYPPAPPSDDDGSLGWALTIANRVKNDAIFQCPSEPHPSPDDGFTDYWINGALLGKSDVRLRFPTSVINLGDGTAGDGVYYTLGPTASPPYWEAWNPNADYTTRHLGGANYCFADGHVKWLQSGQIKPTADPDGANFTLTVG